MSDKKIPLSKINPNPWNPNEMTSEEFDELVYEIKHNARPSKPIVLRPQEEDTYEIVDGEHTYRALKQLGFTELQEDWYEIEEYDDVEAMRQTYKRNLGGKNNPVKLGLMFERALQHSGKSIRQLADEWGMSEGTIRNTLLFAEAKKVRNDYAFWESVTYRQIRQFLNLAEISPVIANLWLAYGAQADALIWNSNETFEQKKARHADIFQVIQNSFTNIIEQGFEDMLSYDHDISPSNLSQEEQEKYIQKFKHVLQKADRLAYLKKQIERTFSFDTEISKEIIKEYLDLCFNSPLFLNAPEHYRHKFSTLIIKKSDNKLEFLLTPDEIRQCMELKKNEGYLTFFNKLKLLIAQKHHLAPSEISDTGGHIEYKMNILEVENRAPEYVKQAKWPVTHTLKRAFIDIPFDDEEERKRAWELIKNIFVNSKEFDRLDWQDVPRYKDKIQEILDRKHLQKEDELLLQKSELELAELFIAKVMPQKDNKDLIAKLVNNFSKDFLFLLVMLGNKFYEWKEFNDRMKALRNSIKKHVEETKSNIDSNKA